MSNSSAVNFAHHFGVMLTANVALSILSSEWYKTQRTQYYNTTNKSSTSSITTTSTTAVSVSPEELELKKKWQALLQRYLAVYLLATGADWLQGPYVYALYAEYGYVQHDIAILFVAGFGSSMIFGSFVGGMADWGGRRAFVVLFAIVYAASCLTKRT